MDQNPDKSIYDNRFIPNNILQQTTPQVSNLSSDPLAFPFPLQAPSHHRSPSNSANAAASTTATSFNPFAYTSKTSAFSSSSSSLSGSPSPYNAATRTMATPLPISASRQRLMTTISNKKRDQTTTIKHMAIINNTKNASIKRSHLNTAKNTHKYSNDNVDYDDDYDEEEEEKEREDGDDDIKDKDSSCYYYNKGTFIGFKRNCKKMIKLNHFYNQSSTILNTTNKTNSCLNKTNLSDIDEDDLLKKTDFIPNNTIALKYSDDSKKITNYEPASNTTMSTHNLYNKDNLQQITQQQQQHHKQIIQQQQQQSLIDQRYLIKNVEDLPVFVTIESYRVASYTMAGEPYLCLPQLLQYLKQKFTLTRMIEKFEDSMIHFTESTPKQVEGFIKASVLPSTAKLCPLITRSDADRICLGLYEQCFKGIRNNLVNISIASEINNQQNQASSSRVRIFENEPQSTILSLARAITSTLMIRVYHRCFGKCIGLYYPTLLYTTKSQCIECITCNLMLTPRRFIGHSHRARENNVCHWGFNSYNWKYYICLSRKQTMNNLDDEELLNQFKILKCAAEYINRAGHDVTPEHELDYVFDQPDIEERALQPPVNRNIASGSGGIGIGSKSNSNSSSSSGCGGVRAVNLLKSESNCIRMGVTTSSYATSFPPNVVVPTTSSTNYSSSPLRYHISENVIMIRVYHRCFGKCTGLYYPSLLYTTTSDCIKCATCQIMLTPRKFVCHTHGPAENDICHWGFDSRNWNYYIRLSRKQNTNNLNDEELMNQFKILRAATEYINQKVHERLDYGNYNRNQNQSINLDGGVQLGAGNRYSEDFVGGKSSVVDIVGSFSGTISTSDSSGGSSYSSGNIINANSNISICNETSNLREYCYNEEK